MSSQYLVQLLDGKKVNFSVSGTSTSQTFISKKKIKIFYFENNSFDEKIYSEIKNATHVLISSPPTTEKSILRYFSLALKDNKNLQWVGYLSSTSVYGNHNGKWVDEKSETKPTSQMGIRRLEAEQLLIANELPLVIFRLAGIYSKERNILNKIKKNSVKIIKADRQIFSRIHIEDIAQSLWLSFKNKKFNNIFNICDDYPCSYQEVTEYAARLLKKNNLEEIRFENLEDGNFKNFFRDKKKVSNKKIKKFGLKLLYPNYKKGLNSILKQSDKLT